MSIALIPPRPDSSSVWFVLGAAAGIYLFYRGFGLLQRKRLIMNTPASKVHSAAIGLVEISGLANGPFSLVAPITGRACYYYHTRVWQWEQRRKDGTWVKKADESLHVPFYLDDNTGRVLVDPQGADLDIHCDFREEFSHSLFSSSLEIPANITNFLLNHGVDTDKKIKIEEYCIKPKNALFVLGTMAQNPGLTVSGTPVRTIRGGVSDQAGRSRTWLTGAMNLFPSVSVNVDFQKFTPAAESGEPAHVLDKAQREKVAAALIKAGITNPAAWAAAGVSQAVPAAVQPSGNSGASAAAAPAPEQFDLRPPVVLMKGANNPAFYISWRSQREVVKGLAWKSALMIWGGPALTLGCVYCLAFQFGWL